jgi:hypothetical protein
MTSARPLSLDAKVNSAARKKIGAVVIASHFAPGDSSASEKCACGLAFLVPGRHMGYV